MLTVFRGLQQQRWVWMMLFIIVTRFLWFNCCSTAGRSHVWWQTHINRWVKRALWWQHIRWLATIGLEALPRPPCGTTVRWGKVREGLGLLERWEDLDNYSLIHVQRFHDPIRKHISSYHHPIISKYIWYHIYIHTDTYIQHNISMYLKYSVHQRTIQYTIYIL